MAYFSLSAAPVLEVEIGKATCWQGQDNVAIPVYVKNYEYYGGYEDYIGSFDLFLQFDRFDIATFVMDSLDTTGTWLGQFPGYILKGSGNYAEIMGAFMFIPPQQGAMPLFKILAHAQSVPDTLSSRTANISIDWIFRDHYGIWNYAGWPMGCSLDTIYDTGYYNCVGWIDGICVGYERGFGPPADSIAVDTFTIWPVDTTLSAFINGSISIRPCGDANGDNKTNLRDISFIINHLYRQGPAPDPEQSADVDKNETINLLDVSGIIDFLYRGGASLGCL
jgi:hypothetical protein